ncbi:MAG TPA: leucine-rich repeat domain-containing protein [Candidatus Kapabacteria bacterium]|nr:leucine-rich repeat domain-containing protein [Candidatus Kapabacteria bacterium]
MKKKIFCFLIMVVVQLSNFIFGAIPAEERAALIALYNSTNGDGWYNNSGWKTPPLDSDGFSMPGTEGNWNGVYIPGDTVTWISLEFNYLKGSIPPELGNLNNLQYLIMDYNQLSGSIPPELGNLSNLQYLSIYGNQLSGCIPSQLGNLGNLFWLELGWNQLSCGIPSELGNLSNLQYLMIESNQLGGGIPPELGNLNNLQVLLLEGNRLRGSIPRELGNLSNLTAFILNDNQLSGRIPSQLGNLNNLQYLWLQGNQLTGIPPELGNLSNLLELFMFNNQLSGSIPPELGKLGNLQYFLMDHNLLSGSIPSELGNLNNLQCLFLSHNQLSGIIPTRFRNLTSLDYLDIDYNCLSANDPALRIWLRNHAPYWDAHQDQCNGGSTTPIVMTDPVSSITSNSAVCGGNVTSEGGAMVTSRGICWSTVTNPTTADSKTNNGAGTGSFTARITGLHVNTTYYVRAYATNIVGTSYGSNMSFTITEPKMHLSHTRLTFGALMSEGVTGAQTVLITNTGSGVLNWTASGNASWLSLSASSGTGDSVLSVSVDPGGLAVGSYTGTITITDPNALNSPQSVSVELQVYDHGTTTAPFGEFTTPVEGSSVYNSIPISGWVLDDIRVENVRIYNDNTYIGEAVFVEGARPDIEAAFPTYPNNYKAGWGYMFLTNFLPNGGNGTYTISAKATDREGNEVTLGTKSITVDNGHAVKPFGSIDTPNQGGTASGKNFANYGWALTPQPNSIPVDGSTINVVIDGVVKGHPVYNVFRSDIAALFPGYANTNGAVGYFYFDTTKLTNGVHTMAWIVTDNAGNSEGIGSRYFSVLNTEANGDTSKLNDTCLSQDELSYQQNQSLETGGEIYIELQELERVEIKLSGERVAPQAIRVDGYLVVSDQLRALPIGSTLDKDRGVFYWQPGPGFVGEYRFVFIGKNYSGQYTKKNIVVNIKPKQ